MEDLQPYVISLLQNDPVGCRPIKCSARVVKFLQKNKISLIDVANNTSHEFFNDFLKSSDFRDAYKDEEVRCNNWEKGFQKIKDEWDNQCIDYIFHKSTGQFPYMSDNLDVLVKNSDFKKAGSILLEIGYVNLRNIQEAHKGFYRKFAGDEVMVPIHLHERVCWGVPFEDNEHLWNNYRISRDVPIVHYPDCEDCILINIAHSFLEDHEIKIFDLLAIRNSLQNRHVDWEYIIRTAKEMKWEHSLYTALIMFDHIYKGLFDKALIPEEIYAESRRYVKSRKWINDKLEKILTKEISMPFVIPHLWTRIHTALRELDDPSFGTKVQRYWQVFGGLFDRLIHLKLGIKNHPPMFITFSGLDGSGKTRHIETLRTNFLTCDINTMYLWNRAGSFPFIGLILKIRRLIRSIFGVAASVSTKGKKGPLTNNSLAIMLWRWFNVFEMIIFYFFKVRVPVLFGKVVIADRYVYDSMVDMEYTAKSDDFCRVIYSILKYLTPKPDLSFFLDVDTGSIIKRGGDEVKEELVTKGRYYKKIITEMEAVCVDNNSEFRKASEKISRIALRAFFSRYPEKFKGYKVISFRYK